MSSIDLYCSLVKETINNSNKNNPEALKKNGEIQHGNNIHFNFDKDNGCRFNVFFFIYTMQDNPSPLNEIFEDQQIHLNN